MLRRATSFLWSKLETPLRRLERIIHLPEKELGFKAPVPLSVRLRMIKRGFLSQSYVAYQLHKSDPSKYLTDFQLFVRTPDLNREYRTLLHDKLLFGLMTRVLPAHAVETFGVIRKGQVFYAGGNKVGSAADYLLDLLRTYPKLVIKPMNGSRGRSIRFLFRHGEELYLNEKPLSYARLRDLVNEMSNDLISCYVEQCPEIAALYPRTVNTLRLLTMWDVEIGEPFVAAAMLRMGRASSYPVDNLSQGGLSAQIDLETGRLGKGLSHPSASRTMTWYTEHPESGARIEGFIVPRWQELKDRVLELCRHVPFLRHVGWDVAITAGGFKIIEGNHEPNLRTLQTHRPLLADQRVAKFYKANQIL
jgi:hypothetical protein